MRPSYPMVHDFLTNPTYAGVFTFGRTREEKCRGADGRLRVRRIVLPREEWTVCLPDHHPGYVGWDEYLATRERLHANMRPRGEGGGAAREGAGLLQGLVRCGRCGRRMQVTYSGADGRSPRYWCVRARDHHGAKAACQALGGQRLDRAVAVAFLEAVSPAGVSASVGAIAELESQHEQRLALQRLAVERAEYEASRAKRQYDACEPENRLVARSVEHAYEQALLALEREQRKLALDEHARPEPLTDPERVALARLGRDLPRLWDAPTTSDRDRKELLRTIVRDVVVTVKRVDRYADVEILWEGGARTQLRLQVGRGLPGRRTSEEAVALVRRLAEHHHDREIAGILNKQGRLTGTGLPFTQARVRDLRQRAGIPAAPPADPDSQLVTIQQAAGELGVSGATVRRWLKNGLLAGEQVTPQAPWRIRLSDEMRRRFVPDVPDGYVRLDEAAKALGVARQTVLHQVQRGERRAIEVTQGRRTGLRIEVSSHEAGLFAQP